MGGKAVIDIRKLWQWPNVTTAAFIASLLAIIIAAPGAVAPVAADERRSVSDNGHDDNDDDDDDNAPSPYFVDPAKLPFDALPGTPSDRYFGVLKGAGYRIEIPKNWNGGLVLYAHGIRLGAGANVRQLLDVPELTVSNPPLRQHLLANGYAWAASSYSRNGYAVETGVRDSMRLLRHFRKRFEEPERVYAMGHSMGGHIVGVLAEKHARHFDGAQPMCGVMGDVQLFDFFLDYNLVAQTLTDPPAEFPPPPEYLQRVAFDVLPKLGFSPPGTPGQFPFALSAAGQDLKTVVRNLTGGQRPTYDAGFIYWNSPPLPFLFLLGTDDGTVAGAVDGVVVGNAGRVYSFAPGNAASPFGATLNRDILRVRFDRDVREKFGAEGIPGITGKIGVPVITLHTLGDLFVNFSMQQVYARRVAAQKRGHLLVQRAIRDVGHCFFSPLEEAAAFDDLVKWVDQGAKPAGDKVLDAAAVAHADYGCRFTRPDRGPVTRGPDGSTLPSGLFPPPAPACPAVVAGN
jgi:pimeloyl-ACP methyl ester carboxylesterase